MGRKPNDAATIRRTEDVYQFIHDHAKTTGEMPTTRQISQACGISMSTARAYLSRLVYQGRLNRGNLGELTLP